MTRSVAAWDSVGLVEPAVDYSRLGNVYLFANGKGGWGSRRVRPTVPPLLPPTVRVFFSLT